MRKKAWIRFIFNNLKNEHIQQTSLSSFVANNSVCNEIPQTASFLDPDVIQGSLYLGRTSTKIYFHISRKEEFSRSQFIIF